MGVAVSKLDTTKIFPMMFDAAKGAAGAGWDDIRATVKVEFKTAAKRIKEIAKGVKTNQISPQQAKMLMKMMKNNLIAAIALVTNQVMITLEKVVNAALKAIKAIVNTAIGLPLL